MKKPTRLALSGILVAGLAPRVAAQTVPLAVDVNPDPNIFETTLTAQFVTVDLDGQGLLANMLGYNGVVPGPEIRVQTGDRVIIHFQNALPVPQTIHCHGIELNNASDGTSVSQAPVMPGGSYTYDFITPRPGVFWYHPHMSTTNAIRKGLYGSIIVTDPNEVALVRGLGVLPRRRFTRTLMLADITVAKPAGQNDPYTFPADPALPWAGGASFPGNSVFPTPLDLVELSPMDNAGNPVSGPLPPQTVPNVQMAQGCMPCRVNEGQHVLVNGRIPVGRAGSPDVPGAVAPGARKMYVRVGEGVRLQIVNAAVSRYFRLRATDGDGDMIPLVRIGGEGGLLDHAVLEGGMKGTLNTKYDAGEIVLGPSQRADVVLAVPRSAAGEVITIWTRDYSRTGTGWALLPSVPVLHLGVAPNAIKPGGLFQLPAGTPLLAHPAINDPVEDIKGLPVDPLTDPATLPGMPPGSPNPTITLTQGPSIDNVQGNFDASGGTPPSIATSRYARVGDLLELEVANLTQGHHPFHHHGFSFQPVRFENLFGSTLYTFGYNEFVDVTDIPPQTLLVYRMRIDDRPLPDGVTPGGAVGRWLFHCHITSHAALGMISELVIVP